ncbi:BrxA/BrxB family bacilliredoxin [Pseudobacillus sp. FSL P4-0506]|uniref:BrxA/BrxB family bacilliredoxin n=1 Tax=Pseudobacillus sp. FSL P4-0506 TaxID=2921576 RepID=UPI0030FCC5BD
MTNAYEEYMKQMAAPMRAELTNAGFKELTTAEEVNEFISTVEGTTLVVVNSVCGCAAGLARPAAVQATMHEPAPEHLVTVFAGQDREATAQMREFFDGYEPSSPSMALLKGQEVVHFVPREHIEGNNIGSIIQDLTKAFDQYCK